LRGELARRLYALPETRAKYLARVASLLTTVFDEAALRAEVARLESLLSSTLHPIQRAQFAGGLIDLRRFIDTRRATLSAALANPPPAPLGARPSPCLAQLGSLSGSFSTTWNTLGASNVFASGTGTFDLTLQDAGVPVMLVGSNAGLDTSGNDGPRVAVNVLAYLPDAGVAGVGLRLVPALYPSNTGPAPFDLFARVGVVVEFRNQSVVPIGLLGQGTLEFTDAGFSNGAPVTGHFSAELFSWPFGG
jgi:hypothetical protein